MQLNNCIDCKIPFVHLVFSDLLISKLECPAPDLTVFDEEIDFLSFFIKKYIFEEYGIIILAKNTTRVVLRSTSNNTTEEFIDAHRACSLQW